VIDVDPTLRLHRPKLPRRLPRPMPDADVERALRFAPLPRVRPALYFAAYAGLRAIEIAQLRADDLHWSDRYVFLRDQKGGGEGTVPLSAPLAEGLATCQLPATGYLFPYLNGQPGHIPPHLLGGAVNRYLHDMGIAHTLHTLRHWYGTQVYRASNHDLRQTQELMRHRTPDTTALYTFVDPDERVSILDRLPRTKGADSNGHHELAGDLPELRRENPHPTARVGSFHVDAQRAARENGEGVSTLRRRVDRPGQARQQGRTR
jgi:integrase